MTSLIASATLAMPCHDMLASTAINASATRTSTSVKPAQRTRGTGNFIAAANCR